MNNDFNDIKDSSNLSFDKVWSNIKPALDAEGKRREKRKRRFIIFWWFTAFVIGGGLLFVCNKELANGSQELGIKNEEMSISKKKLGFVIDELVNRNKEIVVEENNNNLKQNIVNNTTSKNKQLNTQIQTINLNSEQSKSQTNKEDKVYNEISETAINKKQQTNSKKRKMNIESEFKNVQSFTNINQLKPKKESDNSKETNVKKTLDSENKKDVTVNKKVETSLPKPATTNEINKKVATKKQVKSSKPQTKYKYGLVWNLPLQNGVNFLDINTVKQPATLLIPSFWVSKKVGKKHSFQLQLNPYSQYFLNNKAIVSKDVYTINIQSGSQLNNKPDAITYAEIISFNKLISVEAALSYHYHLSNKISLGIGVSNSWITGALMQNKVVKNNTLITRDSLYGINKQDKEFSNLQPTFILGKLDVQYQFRKLGIGVCFSKPINSFISPNVQNKLPINTNFYIKLKIN